MHIEWDKAKRNWTLKERGLDFADVMFVDWDRSITIEDMRQIYSETRYITYAAIKGRLCVFAWCYRASNIRIISLRKANKREERSYARD